MSSAPPPMRCFSGAAGISRVCQGAVGADVKPVAISADAHLKSACGVFVDTDVLRRGASSVSRLGCARSPNAIRFYIDAIVIDALKCVSRRARPHVGIKPRELPPFGANNNAASTIVVKVGVLGVRHALDHVVPASVFARRPESVGGLPSGGQFRSQASAGQRFSRSKTLAKRACLPSAVARTNPSGMSSGSALTSAHNYEPAEAPPGQVNYWHKSSVALLASVPKYASTCTAVFERMAERGERLADRGAEIAAAADGHAADAVMMQQAWPKKNSGE